MLERLRKRYAGFERILIGADFFSAGGAWRSLHRYYLSARAEGRNLLLLDRRSRRGRAQVFATALLAPRGRIVVNSLNSLDYLDVVLLLLWRRDAALYLHETRWMLQTYARTHPLRNRLLRLILRRNRLLCVSGRMAAWLKAEHGARDVHVVYECVEDMEPPRLEPSQAHVVMVGSPSARKGVDLFCDVAREAAQAGLLWHFHWIGGPADADVDLRPEVTWWGWRDNPADILRQARVLFLSSRDDPQPLAALETLRLGVPVVCFRGTGTAEVVDGLPGCAVYETSDAAAALTTLRLALEANPDPEQLRARGEEIAGAGAFSKRLEEALDA